MSFITERTISEVLYRANIVDVIGERITLKRRGSGFTACCPFHQEKTPSFHVTPQKDLFKCFGCGEAGGVVGFLMKYENWTYPEAIENLAAQYNIPVEYEKDSRTPEEIKSEKDRHEMGLLLIDTAAKRYTRELHTNQPEIRHYLLSKRKLKPSTIIEWGIGYAPGSRFIANDIKAAGKHLLAGEIGLVKVNGEDVSDIHNSRITFPVHNHRGQMVGISSRKLPADTTASPKYMNPKESFMYEKSKVLFGLFQSLKGIKRHGCAILTEGYLDVIGMHQAGFDCTVASCGTALTPQQAQLLRKYTDTVVVMRDGDAAGLNAAHRDIKILLAQNIKVFVCILPTGMDADDMSHDGNFSGYMVQHVRDAVMWEAETNLKSGTDPLTVASAIENIADLLAVIPTDLLRNTYLDNIGATYKCKVKLKGALENSIKDLEEQRKRDQAKQPEIFNMSHKECPEWINEDMHREFRFDQLEAERNGNPVGMYFELSDGYYKRLTNFTARPLYHIIDPNNTRRLIEVWNGRKRSLVELPSRSLISMDGFLVAVMDKGNYTADAGFQKGHFNRMVNWLSEKMPGCFELKTLGWQPEGFFAFYNRVIIPSETGIETKEFNENGIVEIQGQHFISLGSSNLGLDSRAEDNMFENDAYLAHVVPKVDFARWAELFCKVYADNAPFGIAYLYITIFKDIVTQVTKCPILYAYGPKGSGKSEFCESIIYTFFSGKNSDGKLISGYNLNPGQGTAFSFYNLMSRYRNCPVHLNEFDENNIEDRVFGSLKAYYDGQGREIGDGSTGKARKTTHQKTNCTLVIAGQYLSTRDDGSVLSRSITCQFNLSRVNQLTQEDQDNFARLKNWEKEGLSGIIQELIKCRKLFHNQFESTYWEVYTALLEKVKEQVRNPETRLVKNYTAALAAIKVMSSEIQLPFSYEGFFNHCVTIIVAHNTLLRENNALNNFWKLVEIMYDNKLLNWNGTKEIALHFDIKGLSELKTATEVKEFYQPKRVLFVRFNLLYAAYAKSHRERSGKLPMDESTLVKYMQDQPYFLGWIKSWRFEDKVTSCFALDYEQLGIHLERNPFTTETTAPQNVPLESNSKENEPKASDDLPF